MQEVLDGFELSDGCLHVITTDNTSTNWSMTCKLQSALVVAGIERPESRNHKSCMAHIIQLALGAFRRRLGVNGRTKSWEAHECDYQFDEHDSILNGQCQRLREEGNARIDKVSAMRPGLVKILENVCITQYFGRPETDLHIAVNACCIHYADSGLSERFHWVSKSPCTNHSTTDYGSDGGVKFNTAVA